jgi:hypothetical protein
MQGVHRLHEPFSVTKRLDLIDAGVAWSDTRGRSSQTLPDGGALNFPAHRPTKSKQRDWEGMAGTDLIVGSPSLSVN